jgi:flagellar hook-associated protein 2
MSTIPTSTAPTTVASATASADAALRQAAQSIISGSTNSTVDVDSLVTALVNAKVAGTTATLTARSQRNTTQLTAIGTIKSVLSLLQSSMKTLSDGTALSSLVATTSGKGLTAATGTSAVAGSYSVSVANIATAQTLTSSAFEANQALGSGTLHLTLGSQSVAIDIDGKKSTLADIASAINHAPGNPGVTATIINGTDGARLVLNASQTGLANGISVAVTSESAALNKLQVTTTTSKTTPATTTIEAGSAWKQSVAGQDASLTIAGTQVTSASNTILSALTGVTLSLTEDAVGTTQTLTLAHDVSDQKTAIGAFVTAYNNFVTTVASYTGFDKTKKPGEQGGTLLGDTLLNSIRNTISTTLGAGVKNGTNGTINLTSIGISLQKDGQLKIDDNALSVALKDNPGTVESLFNAKTGVAATLNTHLTSYLKTGGIIDMRTSTITSDQKAVADQQKQLTTYATQLTKSYNNQFTALNSLMARMNQNSQYLTQLFGGNNSAGALATNHR